MRFLVSLWLTLAAQCVYAQDGWGNLDALLESHLSNPGAVVASYWLPNSADPAQANIALGVLYKSSIEATSSVYVELGVFARQADGWAFAGSVQGVFGLQPRDVAFGNGFAELSTLRPGLNDPRCCPTQLTRWRIDLGTLQAVPLP